MIKKIKVYKTFYTNKIEKSNILPKEYYTEKCYSFLLIKPILTK